MYKNLVRLQEGTRTTANGIGYVLMMSTCIDDDHPIEEEIRHLNEALINWVRSRGDRSSVLVIVYAAAPALLDAILSATIRLMSQDIPEASAFRSLDVNVTFIDGDGRRYHDVVLRPPAAHGT